jgi:hypothetical protein
VNALVKLILKHLDIAAPHMLPEETLFVNLRDMVRPVATEEQFRDAVYLLLQKEFIGFVRDELTDEKKFFIKEAGQAAYRRVA